MQKTRPLSSLIAVLVGLAACLDATAVGFGRAPQTAVLGQPLEFAVPLRLDPGETLTPDCLSAEVTVGDNRLPSYLVRALLEPQGADAALVRIVTTSAVDEPVVAVTIGVGCQARVSRRFLLLADPPSSALALAAPVVLALASDVPSAPAAASEAARGVVMAMAAPVQATAAETAAPRPAAKPPAKAAPASTAKAAARPAAPKPARKTSAAPLAEPVARLKLDVIEPMPSAGAPVAAAVIEEAFAAVEAAASAARASAVAASAAAQRIAALEASVDKLRVDAQASRDDAARWRAEAADASANERWARILWLAVIALAGLAGWLAWRQRTARLAGQRDWRRAVAAGAAAPAAPSTATAPIPLVNSELELPLQRPAWPAPMVVPSLARAEARPKAALVVDLPIEPVDLQAIERTAERLFERTDVLPPNLSAHEGAARDVSIEELLDLEQQAEFFVALGQDEAAIDLLVEHLRGTGGGSPLPYLKLLEIYRRRDESAAYERTRARFNDRFNAYAPDWQSDLQAGRVLEQYPGILPRLQVVWPRPLDAMAELEALLFRKSRGELFDLPAYREVLFLYSLARDLLEREPSDAGQVDLLLPLSDAGETGATPAEPAETPDDPAQYRSDHRSDHRSDRPTAPVDLDLSLPTGADSVFHDLPADGRRG